MGAFESCRTAPQHLELLLPQHLALTPSMPPLTDFQLQFLSQNDKLNLLSLPILSFQSEYFQGQLNQKLEPQGFGLFLTQQGAIFVGQFSQQFSKGELFYVLSNGAYFKGMLSISNISQGSFHDPKNEYYYEGFLIHSVAPFCCFLPHGRGQEQSAEYSFQGEYQMGERLRGKLTWTSNNFKSSYEGNFNVKGQFTGEGVLIEQTGCYKGQFEEGFKQGKGRYQFLSGLIYQGNYRRNLKQGWGKILNSDQTLCYEGEFRNDLPHGKGRALFNNKEIEGDFVEGLLLEQSQYLFNSIHQPIHPF